MTTAECFAETANQRAAVYRLLARFWRAELDAELLRELQTGASSEAFRAAGGIVPSGGAESDVLDQLAIDFCQLFVGPSGHLPPVQSVWSEGQFERQAAVSLRRYLDVIGDQAGWLSQNPLDHLAVQLDIMGFVVEQSVPAPTDQTESLDELAKCFYRDHVAWARTLCESAARRCQTEFYRGVIKMTSDFLEHEHEHYAEGHARNRSGEAT